MLAKKEIDDSRVLFCNITYMKYYKGITDEDKPVNGGKYIKDTGDANEKYNFFPHKDGFIRGFVETKHRKGYADTENKPNQLRIENIDENYKEKESINGVLVIFCAKPKDSENAIIVGWYENAIVYRYREYFTNEYGDEYEYNIMVAAHNAHLIDEENRIKNKFEIPRSRKKENPGIGSSNVFFANSEKNQELRRRAIEYIKNYENVSKEIQLNEISDIEEIENNYSLKETEKEVLTKTRIGQGLFRNKLFNRDNKCVICGLKNKNLLVASHIKPWSKCNGANEKLNPNNGLLLCVFCDALFDKGFITFDEEGKILVSKNLSDEDRKFLRFDHSFRIKMNDEMKQYMKWHNDNLSENSNWIYSKKFK